MTLAEVNSIGSGATPPGDFSGAIAGAAGASTGEMTAKLALDLYGKKPEQLCEDERQLVSALSSVAAGLAGAAVSDNTASVQTAAQAGKNAVENNALNGNDAQEKSNIQLAFSETGLTLHPRSLEEIESLEKRRDQLLRLSEVVDQYVKDACSQGIASTSCQEANVLLLGLQQSYDGYLGSMTYKDLNKDEYAKVSQLIAETTGGSWDYTIEDYAKTHNISY
ncbi:VENN motif pre-toxin domain-containing protein [Cronobacter turicensis]